MDNQQEIDRLQQQLADLRREFTYYLKQRALHGNVALPYQIARKIDELSDTIRQTQQALRDLGASLDDKV